MERVAHELLAVRKRERGTEISDAPLDDLVLADARPKGVARIGFRRARLVLIELGPSSQGCPRSVNGRPILALARSQSHGAA